MIIVHYEVYVLEGRGWMLHARFPRTERDTAVAEAKELEQTLNVRVKVLRETYYTDDNAFDEAEIYVSGMKMPDKPRPQASAPPAASKAGARKGGTPAKPGKPARPATTYQPPARSKREAEDAARMRQLLGRLLGITAVALACSMFAVRVTPDAIMLLWKMGFVIPLTKDTYGQTLFAVFVLTFLMVAVPLSLRFLPRKTRLPAFHRPSSGGEEAKAPEDLARERKVKKSLNKLAAQEIAKDKSVAADADDLPEIADVSEEDAGERRKDDVELAAELEAKAREQLEAALGEAATAAQNAKPEPEETKPREPEKVAPTEPEKPAKEPPATATPEEQKEAAREKKEAESVETLQPTVMRFLNGAVNQAKVIMPSMDAFTKFALHLYLAGAVETLCEFKKLGESAKSKLVAFALETLGTKGDLARKFYDKIEEYLLEPRYLGVVQAGRNAMGDFMLGDEAGAHQALRDVFTEWNRKSDKKAQIITVMFTDMVGSTDMTQARGDVAAQEVVRRHNAIVRGALAQFGGKEVKHTGDGIMASFATAAAAVEASVAIQRQVNQHNRRQGSSDLHLRIGLNAGEPIEEEDDLFGTTVQLAARVCAATNPDEVLCTGVVKDLAFGKGAATFKPKGEKYLKGFKDSVPLFEVVWH